MADQATVTITFIRHGESTDNLSGAQLPIWAGWRDAPLSELGMKQAAALGASLSTTKIDLILASTLKRAYSTAEAVLATQPDPKPPIEKSPLLREQTRGVAEGHPWLTEPKPGLSLEEHYAQNLYPIHHERWQKFPGGESIDDLSCRAEQAVEEVILPHVRTAVLEGKNGFHIAVASHGLFIAEMVPALLKRDPTNTEARTVWRGMHNTGWTRVTVGIAGSELRVKVTDFDSHAHLKTLAESAGSGARDSIQTFAGKSSANGSSCKAEVQGENGTSKEEVAVIA